VPAPPRRRHAAGTIVALLFIVAGIVSALVINHRRQFSSQFVQDPNAPAEAPDPRTEADLPVLGTVDPFSLTERSGKTITLEDLKGRVWIAESFFTYCGSLCPKMFRNLSQLHREFTGKDEPKIVSITADPLRDTLEAITEYARTYQADTERWWFLRGEEEQLRDLTMSLLLTYKIGDPTAHNGNFMLVDRDGRIRGKYVGTILGGGTEMDKLRRDLRLLLAAPKKP
jgi:cytochrome oxidase Cu insertion factor (SCO1/SenC/PrrC family)